MKFIQILDFFFCISIVTLSAKLNFEIVLRYAQIIDFPVYYTVQMTSKKAIVYIHITQATIGSNLYEVVFNFHTSTYIFTRFFVSFYVYPRLLNCSPYNFPNSKHSRFFQPIRMSLACLFFLSEQSDLITNSEFGSKNSLIYVVSR